MRTTVLAMIYALAALPAAVTAQASPASTHPLAANEVLLQLSSMGTATSPADLAELRADLMSQGATVAEAHRMREAQIGRLTAAARRAGIAADDVVVGEARNFPRYRQSDLRLSRSDLEDAGIESTEVQVELVEAILALQDGSRTEPVVEPGFTLLSRVLVRVRNLEKVEEISRTLSEMEPMTDPDLSDPDITYSVSDQSRARQAARVQALAAARADAEAHAASMGLRVVRVARVTERMGMELMSLMMSENRTMRGFLGNEEDGHRESDIPTYVAVGVDFVLAPQ